MYRLHLDVDSEQAADQRHLQGALPSVLSSQVVPQPLGPASRTLLSIWRRERDRFGAHRFAGELRCVIFEKLRCVELVNDSWRTAPNHSRQATCDIESDLDAEDQPDRDPQ